MSNGSGGGKDWFSRSMANGLISTIAWTLVLIIYCTFRAFKIEDPLLGQAFLLLTGAWVGTLTIAQGKKNQQTEQKVEKLEQVVKEKVADLDE